MTGISRRADTKRGGAGLGLVLMAAALAYPASLAVWLLGHGWIAALATLILGGPLLVLGLAAASTLRGSDPSRSDPHRPRATRPHPARPLRRPILARDGSE
jgi:hypothetical protein